MKTVFEAWVKLEKCFKLIVVIDVNGAQSA